LARGGRGQWAAALLALLVVSLAIVPALAVQPDEMLADRKLEARARIISEELRCLVCQNQSIDDSDAQLAHDLRVLVRDRLKAGDTNDEVRDFIVARYGDFVLLKPPFKPETLLLWAAPALVLALGGLGIWISLRRRRALVRPTPLSAEEQAALERVLQGER
jgi:cytochrome c-type biogenesis protein CcmH